jgi:Abortive infection alpha
MSEESKAVQETAKAVQEVAKASVELREIVEQVGVFIGQIIGPPARELSGLVTDQIAFRRRLNVVSMQQRFEEVLAARGVDRFQSLPLSIGYPLIEAASVEDDPVISDMFANLLASFVDGDRGRYISKQFIEALRNITPYEAALLKAIAMAPEKSKLNGALYTYNLPESYMDAPTPRDEFHEEPSLDLQMALSSLQRSGCIEGLLTMGGGTVFRSVRLTAFGAALSDACGIMPTQPD